MNPSPAVGLPAECPRHEWICPNECVTLGLESLSSSLGEARLRSSHVLCCRNRRHNCNHTRQRFVPGSPESFESIASKRIYNGHAQFPRPALSNAQTITLIQRPFGGDFIFIGFFTLSHHISWVSLFPLVCLVVQLFIQDLRSHLTTCRPAAHPDPPSQSQQKWQPRRKGSSENVQGHGQPAPFSTHSPAPSLTRTFRPGL